MEGGGPKPFHLPDLKLKVGSFNHKHLNNKVLKRFFISWQSKIAKI